MNKVYKNGLFTILFIIVMLLSSCGRGNDENEISNTGTSQIEDNTDSPIIIGASPDLNAITSTGTPLIIEPDGVTTYIGTISRSGLEE